MTASPTTAHAPHFRQGLPRDRTWTLVENLGGTLFYQDDKGSQCLVPNIWYNQTPEMRATALHFYAKEERTVAAYKRATAKTAWDRESATRHASKARRLNELAAEILRTQNPLLEATF